MLLTIASAWPSSDETSWGSWFCPTDAVAVVQLDPDGWSGGTRSMNRSPMADTLLTAAVTLSGTGVPLFSRIRATTIVGELQRITRPMVKPGR